MKLETIKLLPVFLTPNPEEPSPSTSHFYDFLFYFASSINLCKQPPVLLEWADKSARWDAPTIGSLYWGSELLVTSLHVWW